MLEFQFPLSKNTLHWFARQKKNTHLTSNNDALFYLYASPYDVVNVFRPPLESF